MLYNKAYDTVRKYKMLSYGESVVVGLSGGADSCALLDFLVSVRDELGLKISACHINHQLRGAEADRDEHFAEGVCERYGVKLYILHADVKGEAVRQKKSTEQCGRDIRYAFFEKTADMLGAKIATAHTASDNAETVLFNLARGSGAAGLCGIPPVRGNIIRPLIECTRSDIENYCRERNLEYVTDSTNLTDEYTRNKIRLEVIPKLKEINPSFENAVSGMTERMMQTMDFINKSAENILESAYTENGYRISVLQEADEAVLSQAIMIICKKNNVSPEAKHIELIKKIVYNSGAVEIKQNVFAVSKQGFLRMVQKYAETDSQQAEWNGQENISINNKKISLCKVNKDEFYNSKKIDKRLFDNSMDYDTIPLTAVFRTRCSGDVFKLPRRKVTKSVKKLFSELKIPQEQRDKKILLADGCEILWIEGVGASEKVSVKKDTENIVFISCTLAE